VLEWLVYEAYLLAASLRLVPLCFLSPSLLGIAGKEGRRERWVLMVAVCEVLSSGPPTIGSVSSLFLCQ
jgi:hypothetical protein